MADVLKGLPKETNPDLLVGFNTADDAGIFRINDTQALVQTVDFFPPIVDDPYYFGQIAAANALSDIYAMGGLPLTALNIVGFPPKMPPSILKNILLGGAEKIRESGAVVVGGHSIKDNELKYGVACTGIIDIDKIVTNAGAKVGDRLFLTKPLGTGIITTAIKQKMAGTEDIAFVTRLMAQLNRDGAELMIAYKAHSATDITGYGILGHAHEMAVASGVTIRLVFDSLPLIPNVLTFAEAGALTGGANANRDYLKDVVSLPDSLAKAQTDVLFDAQTSGGLLIAIPDGNADAFVITARERKIEIAEIGRVETCSEYSIIVE